MLHLCQAPQGAVWYPGHLAVPAAWASYVFLFVEVRVLQRHRTNRMDMRETGKSEVCRADVPV